MRMYLATRFLFPRSYHLRIFAVCFVAVHLPLVVFCATQLSAREWQWQLFIPLLLATLVGTGGGIVVLAAMLAPIRRAVALLESVHNGELITAEPITAQDLAGELLMSIGVAANSFNSRLSQLRDVAERDVLTGLRNRRGFLNAAAHLRRGTRATLALIDIDFFKRVNDVFGHDEGDIVLQEFGHRLSEAMRRSDLVGRWGGEEFAVLIPGTGPREGAALVERLRETLRERPLGPDPESPVTFSCGLALLTGPDDLAAAMQRADKALYRAKSEGRDQLVHADSGALAPR